MVVLEVVASLDPVLLSTRQILGASNSLPCTVLSSDYPELAAVVSFLAVHHAHIHTRLFARVGPRYLRRSAIIRVQDYDHPLERHYRLTPGFGSGTTSFVRRVK